MHVSPEGLFHRRPDLYLCCSEGKTWKLGKELMTEILAPTSDLQACVPLYLGVFALQGQCHYFINLWL